MKAGIRKRAMHREVEQPGPDLQRLGEFYDHKYEGTYCAEHGKGRHWSQVRCLLEYVPDRGRPLRVLDYGCGSGGMMELLEEMFPKAEIHGIDISDVAVRKAEARFPHHRFSALDGSRASYPDGGFDVLFSCHVLEHVGNLKETLADMARLVREGGFLCLTLPCANAGSFEWRLTMLTEGALVKSATNEEKWFWEADSHLRRIPSAQLVSHLAALGCEAKAQFFGNQFWGGVEYIGFCGPSTVLEILRTDRAKGLWQKTKVIFAKAALLSLSPMFLINMDLREKARRFRGFKKWLCRVAVPLKLLYRLPATVLSQLADREWRIRRFEPHGASQFLFFQKRTGHPRAEAGPAG